MSNDHIKRINPRRPYQLTATGIKRIILGATDGLLSPLGQVAANHGTAKPLRTPAIPKQQVLVIAHSDRGMLDGHARQAIAAAAILASAETAVIALVLGELHEDLSDAGADQVIVIPELDYQLYQPDVELGCVNAIVNSVQATRIYMPDNLIGDGDLGRRFIAQHPEKTAATQVVEVDAEHIISYQTGGTLLAFSTLPEIILLAADAVDTRLPFTSSALQNYHLTSHVANKHIHSPYQDLGMQTIAAAEVALEEADFIVSAGNGVHHVATLESLASSLDAAIGASRVAVDDGKFTRDKQIGATGKTVTASAYLAIGISGAVQHLQGIKDCRHVIVINRDHSAPIVKRANLSVIGDAEEIMQDLISTIAQAKTNTVQEAA